MVVSGFDLFGGGVEAIATVSMFATTYGINDDFGLTNNYLVTKQISQSNLEIYNKTTRQKAKSVPGAENDFICGPNTIIVRASGNFRVFDEQLNLISTFNTVGIVHSANLDGIYLYVYSGGNGSSDHSMKKYNITTGRLVASGPGKYGTTAAINSDMDNDFIYTCTPDNSKAVLKISKTNLSIVTQSQAFSSPPEKIYVLKEYVFVVAAGVTYKLNKSNLALAGQYSGGALGRSREELYMARNTGFEPSAVVIAAVDENFNLLRESAISVPNEITMDRSDTVDRPTFYYYRTTSGSVRYLEKAIDLGGTLR